jgi:hypothetical protein
MKRRHRFKPFNFIFIVRTNLHNLSSVFGCGGGGGGGGGVPWLSYDRH